MANIMVWQGDPLAARRCMEESLAMWRELADQAEVALALEGIGWAQLLNGEDEVSLATFEECLALQRTIGSPALVLRLEVAVTQVLVALHRVDEGRALAEKIVAAASARGDRRNEHFGWHFLADCALIAGQCEESLALYRKALGLAHVIGDRLETSFEVQGVAMSLAGMGDNVRALRLAGAVQGEWERIGADPHMRFWDELLERYIGAARQALGPGETERAWREGLSTAFQQAIDDARGDQAVSRGTRSE
jgi:tetratricopeptide (TPR) repeat protein